MITVSDMKNMFINWFSPVAFGNAIDKLNYIYTVSLLCVFSAVVFVEQCVGTPIQCSMLGESKSEWKGYVETYCFMQNTFVPSENSSRAEAEISYYQWVPFVLALQAVMFYMPSWLWTTLHTFSELDLTMTMTDAEKIAAAPLTSKEREKTLSRLSLHLEEYLEFGEQRRTPAQLFCFGFGRGLGSSYMASLCLLMRGLYILNILAQFYILNRFLDSSYSFWGIQIFMDLYNGRGWMDSGVFPQVTRCNFDVLMPDGIHHYTAQCLLTINTINEKIYLFIWFWFLLVAVVTAINFFYTLLYMSLREKSTRQWLKQAVEDENKYRHKQAVRNFCHQALGLDGVLILQFIESRTGEIVVRDVAAKMFGDYIKSLRQFSMQTTSPGIPKDGAHKSCFYIPFKPYGSGPMMSDYPTKADR